MREVDVMLTSEEVKLKEEVREFVLNEIEPVAHEIDKREEFPKDLFKKIIDAGYFAVPFPKEYGGMGYKRPVLCSVLVLEQFAYSCNGVAGAYDAQCLLSGWTLLMHGNESQKEYYLRDLIEGKKIFSFATTEPWASSDLRSIRTYAKEDGDYWILNGHKRFITNSPVADYMITWAKTEKGLSGFIVDMRKRGVKVGKPDLKMGNRGQLTADVILEDVEVSKENVIGEIGKGMRYALSAITVGRIGVAATGVGMAQASLDEAISYVKKREQFGKRIGEFQGIQFKIAEMAIMVETARNLTYKAGILRDSGIVFPEPYVAMAKAYSTKIAVDCAREAVQIFGGLGFINELGYDGYSPKVERIYRDAKISEIYEGTNEIQKIIISRELLGKDLVRTR